MLTVMFDTIDFKCMIFVHIPIFISLFSVMLVFEENSALSQIDDNQKSFFYFDSCKSLAYGILLSVASIIVTRFNRYRSAVNLIN